MNETDTLMSEVSKVWNTVLYYEQLIKGYVCWRCQKKLKIHYKGCNAMYAEGVKRDSKYTISDHNMFDHNFLNFQLIFNPQKVLESWDLDLGLSNHIIKCYVCWSMWKVLKVKNSFTTFDIDSIVWLESPESQPSKTFFRLKISWILRKLWAKMCKIILNFFQHCQHR